MKKLAILLLMTGVVLAQPSMEKPDRNRLEMMKMWKLTDELELTEEQAEKFFPQYRTLMSDLEDVTKQQHEVMKQIGELSKEKEVDGKKLDNLVKQANDFEKKKIDLNGIKKRATTMYNRNYGGFDYVRIHSELLTPVLNRKSLTLIP